MIPSEHRLLWQVPGGHGAGVRPSSFLSLVCLTIGFTVRSRYEKKRDSMSGQVTCDMTAAAARTLEAVLFVLLQLFKSAQRCL